MYNVSQKGQKVFSVRLLETVDLHSQKWDRAEDLAQDITLRVENTKRKLNVRVDKYHIPKTEGWILGPDSFIE